MTALPGLVAAARLTRPRQWPILSVQLAVGAVLALPRWPALAGAAAALDPWPLVAAWVAWVVMLNGGTLAYNSAWDRDTDAVAYLPRPPSPPPWLAAASLALMICGIILGALAVSPAFGLVTAVCVAMSVAYSHPRPRWKSRSGLDLLVNMLGYGAGTTAAGVLAGQAALPPGAPYAVAPAALAIAAFGLLFGSFYPLTQIYQEDEDRRRGDRTLVVGLGVRGALGLALGLGLGALAALQVALALAPAGAWRWLPAAALFLWLAHLVRWRQQASGMDAAANERGMYLALALWAVVDATLVTAWLAPRGAEVAATLTG